MFEDPPSNAQKPLGPPLTADNLGLTMFIRLPKAEEKTDKFIAKREG